MATVKYDTKTGKKLSAGQTTTVAGKTVVAGSTYNPSPSSSSSTPAKTSSSGGGSGGGGGGSSPSLSTPINIDSNPGQSLAPGQVYTYKGQTYTQPGGSSSSSNSSVSQGTTPTTTQKGFTLTGGTLQQGSTGENVKQLQTQLGITADGIYGPQTAAAVKAYQAKKGLTVDGIVGLQTTTQLAKDSVGYSAPAATAIDTKVPGIDTAPVLPKTEDYNNSYIETLNQQIADMQFKIDNQRNEQIQQIQQDKQQAQQELSDYRNSQQDAIDKGGDVATQAMEMKLSETNKEIARMDEAYKQKQSFVDQLMQLTTQGNALIASQKATTGLTAIRNPRVNETIANITAQAGTIQIGISAQENNMTQAQNQLTTVVAAITNTFKEQLDYYQTLADFYDTRSTETNQKLITLTKDELILTESKPMQTLLKNCL
jgi:peptidoglycan hydrolase-like protein with peptidoglycan-binding domain